MEKITFVQPGIKFVRIARMMAIFMVFGLFSLHGIAATHTHTLHSQLNFAVEGGNASSKVSMWELSGLWNPFEASIGNPDDCDGDGVTCEQEVIDGTDPNDPCDFILEHQNCTPSTTWLNMDCDGDGVTNGKEKYDGTDPLDPCSFVLEHQNCTPTTKWKNLDCDGDGVTNGKEKEDGTDPLDPCDLVLEHQNCSPSYTWKNLDCDGDGVTNGKEKEDGTDPFDPCDFIWGHQNCTPTQEWKDLDCDGDGVTNGDENEDGTNPLDPCDYNPDHVTLPQSGDYLTADCDGDGVTNEDEIEDGTDPNDSCDFNLESQTVDTSSTWNMEDCDGDGVTNGDEKEDGTDPLDPCDYNPESVTLPQSAEWEALDCDNDGNPNGTDPNPLEANAMDDSGATPALTEVAINILENDDFLPNNDPNNVGSTSLSSIGGNALGTVTFDAETGFVNYTPVASESNSTVTIIYQVCNVLVDPNVCASATIFIEVGPNTIDAVDDTYVSDTSGGIIPDSNVLSNDTLNGEPVSLEDVILTSTPTDVLTVNEDGTITVAPDAAPGTYTVEYTICEIANVDNCDTATVTVEVQEGMGNTIDAVDDSYVSDTSGGIIPDSNVLSNDTLNGEPVTSEDVILTSTPTDVLTINDDGTIIVISGTQPGTYTISYTICEIANVDNCDTAIVTVVIEDDAASKIEVNQMLTPNGDLKNDFLFIRGVERIKTSTLKIFNRWGVVVYEGKNYDNVRNVFDGRSRGRSTLSVNEYLPAGVYFYIFNYETDEGSFTDSEYIYISR